MQFAQSPPTHRTNDCTVCTSTTTPIHSIHPIFKSSPNDHPQILFGTGDCMAQQLVEKRGLSAHDPARTLRMCGYGGLIFGPAATTWYGILTKHVNFASKNGTIVARVACDQLLFAPVNMGACGFLYILWRWSCVLHRGGGAAVIAAPSCTAPYPHRGIKADNPIQFRHLPLKHGLPRRQLRP